MSLQFSRSIRSLRIDSFRASRIGLLLGLLIMSALIAWFFFAKVTLYETSASISFTENGRLMAVFTPEAIKRIQPGQSAILRLSPGADQSSINASALVYGVETEQNNVELLVMTPGLSAEIPKEKLSGQVEVEVEYITPAKLVLRTSGKVFNNNKNEVPFSPQIFKETEAP
jgi:hypothetical protein